MISLNHNFMNCSFVLRYMKIRVLTHHTVEEYSNCALTRIQVFGPTILQSIDKLRFDGSSEQANGKSLPPEAKVGVRSIIENIDKNIRNALQDKTYKFSNTSKAGIISDLTVGDRVSASGLGPENLDTFLK